MQFKSLAFLSILSILFFTACDSKNDNGNNVNEPTEKEVAQKVDFQLTTTDNQTIDLTIKNNKVSIKNDTKKIVLLNFFATWCPPCKAEIPNLINLENKYGNDFEVISILLEKDKSNEEINEFIKKFNINYKVANSPANFEVAKALGGVKSIPTMFMIDKESNIFQKYVGVVPVEMMEIDIKKVLSK